MRRDRKPPIAPLARPGDLWSLGQHRLVVGDSGDPETMDRLMQGDRADLVLTSPPYGNQRAYTTSGIADWNALMQSVFRQAGRHAAETGQMLVNLGLIHRKGEWEPYWQAWLDWMRTLGWRRFGLYVWDQGPGLPGDWNGRLAPAFEFVFHLNRQARRPNKTVPCRWAGHINGGKGGLRAHDGTVGAWTHAARPVQTHRIPDSVIRVTRHKARGIETEHPAVFPLALPEALIGAYTNPGDLVLDPFAGAGTTLLAAERAGRRVRAAELAPAYADIILARWAAAHPAQPAVLEERQHGAARRQNGAADHAPPPPEISSSFAARLPPLAPLIE